MNSEDTEEYIGNSQSWLNPDNTINPIISFDTEVATMDFSTWLNDSLPSNYSKNDGIMWITVCSASSPQASMIDLDGLLESWEMLKDSGRTITLQTITELAKKHNVLSGKWLFYATTGMKIDLLWTRVARGVYEGRCGHYAKVSTFDSEGENHVVCIYNNDFTNYDQIMDLENSIRSLGIKGQLMYKPDVYTYLGIYSQNEWGLKPTIYRSVFDIMKGCSKVKETESFAEMANSPSFPHI